MKNFTRINGSLITDGMLLLNIHSSELYEPFQEYVELLIQKGFSKATIQQYAGHVSRFIDFVYELQFVSKEKNKEIDLSKVFNLYQDYLTQATNSLDPLVQQVAINIGKDKSTSFKSISAGIEASLNLFMELKLFETDSSYKDLFTKEHELSHQAITNIVKTSWFEATKKKRTGQSKSRRIQLFPIAARRNVKVSIKKETKEKADKAFPTVKCLEFFSSNQLDNLSSLSVVRDFLLYAFLAASGVRQSEALQITIDDINWEKRVIQIVSPFSRRQTGLTSQETESLSDKGRVTSHTFLIQPFASIFWSLLKLYIENHYKENVSHRYLFQKYNGRPFFAANKSERSKAFKKYLKKFDPELSYLGLHSFRHMYAFYTLNYFPLVDKNGILTNQQGLPMAYVKILMGHQNITSTAVYARQDIELVEFMIAASNNHIRNNNISLKDMAKQFYNRQVQKIDELLRKECQ